MTGGRSCPEESSSCPTPLPRRWPWWTRGLLRVLDIRTSGPVEGQHARDLKGEFCVHVGSFDTERDALSLLEDMKSLKYKTSHPQGRQGRKRRRNPLEGRGRTLHVHVRCRQGRVKGDEGLSFRVRHGKRVTLLGIAASVRR